MRGDGARVLKLIVSVNAGTGKHMKSAGKFMLVNVRRAV